MRPAPLRMALSAALEMPLLLLLMLPASLIVSGLLNFLGGKKSRPVNVDDFRSKCLLLLVGAFFLGQVDTYGLGRALSSSYEFTSGETAGTLGW